MENNVIIMIKNCHNCYRYAAAQRYAEALDILQSGASIQLRHGQVIFFIYFFPIKNLFYPFSLEFQPFKKNPELGLSTFNIRRIVPPQLKL